MEEECSLQSKIPFLFNISVLFRPACFEQIRPRSISPTKEAQSNDYQIVSRFENFGGGWGYSGHSVEAIRFMSDTDILLCKTLA